MSRKATKKTNTATDTPVVNTKDQFYQAKLRFREFSGYTHELTYDEWMSAPDECKAAILYVQFYDQITLAWYKTQRSWIDINDGVSEVLQYLHKNVEKIKKDGKRFTPNYIYRVVWNCLSCLCWDDPGYSRRARIHVNEMSNIVGYGEDELNLFDTLIDDDEDQEEIFDTEGTLYRLANATMIWDIVEEMGQKAKYVVANLLGEKSYTPSQFRSVSEEETEEILEELRTRLSKFRVVFG